MNASTLAERQITQADAPQRAQPGIDPDFDRLLRQGSFGTRDMLQGNTFDKVSRLAEMMASGRATIPKHLQGNVGDCAAIIGQAMRWGMDHIAVAQKTHIVNGTLGYEAQLVVAVLNNSPLLASRINYRWSDGWDGTKGKEDQNPAHWCEVSATLRGETEPRVLRITMAQVGGVRNSPNWATDARQQLAYLGAKRWGRLHAPDVLLGVYTPDELQYGRDDDPLDEHQPKPPTVAPRPELPMCLPEDFEADFPKFQKVVASGKKTADELLATLSTRARFTPEQQARILALKGPAAPAAAPASQEKQASLDAVPALTFAQVADAIVKAKSLDELEVAGEAIGQVADEGLRGELRVKYEARRAALEG